MAAPQLGLILLACDPGARPGGAARHGRVLSPCLGDAVSTPPPSPAFPNRVATCSVLGSERVTGPGHVVVRCLYEVERSSPPCGFPSCSSTVSVQGYEQLRSLVAESSRPRAASRQRRVLVPVSHGPPRLGGLALAQATLRKCWSEARGQGSGPRFQAPGWPWVAHRQCRRRRVLPSGWWRR